MRVREGAATIYIYNAARSRTIHQVVASLEAQIVPKNVQLSKRSSNIIIIRNKNILKHKLYAKVSLRDRRSSAGNFKSTALLGIRLSTIDTEDDNKNIARL